MPSTLAKNLHMCFTKIKRPENSGLSPTPLNPDDQSRPISSTSSSVFIKNFNSLYDDPNAVDYSTSKSLTNTLSTSSSSLSSESEPEIEPDFATVFASDRFFFTCPGRSNSIIESAPSVVTTPESTDTQISNNDHHHYGLHKSTNGIPRDSVKKSFVKSPSVKDSVAVSTDSPDPYVDFRRSMQEMVEARGLIDVNANWDYLHELLLCYLALNPKNTHKFIIGAFADLLVSLMPSPETEIVARKPDFPVAGD